MAHTHILGARLHTHTQTQIVPLCNTQIKQSYTNTLNTGALHNNSNDVTAQS